MARTARAVVQPAPADSSRHPVVFFNASARLGHLSQNAAFSLLSTWGLRLSGVPVVHFVCNAGMSRCVLGTNPDSPQQPPPCTSCIAQSKRLFQDAHVHWFAYREQADLSKQLSKLTLAQLSRYKYGDLPLGEMALPGLRWALRRQDLVDDERTRFLLRSYILSAYNVAREFEEFLATVEPQAVVVFNGIMFPEAVVRRVAQQHGVRVITHEVGLLPLSAFFTDGQATAYPMSIPPDFQLSGSQDQQLDNYLGKRFQGDFSMAGIRFWPQMHPLDERFLSRAAKFKQVVPVFTNVVFDTSQVHANKIFADMFDWLDGILKLVRDFPETLFVIRAHPDEFRPGTRKQSRQSVAQWGHAKGVEQLPNVIFVDANEYLDSYALILKAHFVMVYNSSIGLEASILGKPVLCAGAARYTQYPTVFFPSSATEYMEKAREFLSSETVAQPEELIRQARRVLYFQLFKTSLPFSQYLEPHGRMGYVRLRSFPATALLPENSPAIAAVYHGIVDGSPFLV